MKFFILFKYCVSEDLIEPLDIMDEDGYDANTQYLFDRTKGYREDSAPEDKLEIIEVNIPATEYKKISDYFRKPIQVSATVEGIGNKEINEIIGENK